MQNFFRTATGGMLKREFKKDFPFLFPLFLTLSSWKFQQLLWDEKIESTCCFYVETQAESFTFIHLLTFQDLSKLEAPFQYPDIELIF